MTTNRSGTVESYDRTRARGVVLVDDERVDFHTTAFYGTRGQRHPRIGDNVQVIFAEDDVLAVVLG